MKFSYDKEGNLKETKYKDEKVETRYYNDMNQLVRTDNVDNTRDTKEYDVYGNLTKETTNNRTTTYSYNKLNQLESRTNDDGTITFEYDSWGQLIKNSSASGDVTVGYDDFQHITSVGDVNGKEVKYTYDEKGRKASVVYPSGSYAYYTYDIFDRLVKVEDGSDTTTYEYDASGNPILEKNSKLETHREFDSLDRLIYQRVIKGEDVISELEYTRNAYGDVLTSTERNEGKKITLSYEYDKLNQVTQEIKVEDNKTSQIDFDYDFRGNKLKETKTQGNQTEETRYAYNKEFQLVSIVKPESKIDLTYDKHGNVIEKAYSNGLTETYEYDASNQLTDITDNYGKHITHDYDGLGNRTGRREEIPYNYNVTLPEDIAYDSEDININDIIDNASDAISNVIDNKYYCTVTTLEDTTRVVEETFVNDLAQEHAQVLETSRNDEEYESYTYGLTRLSTQSQQGTSYHIINGKFDIIGTVGDKKTSWSTFSLFGKTHVLDTPRFGYSSEAHEGTLQYLRARYYDTETGIFLSKDTYTGTQFNGLSQNRYIYTENNPVNRTDPSGNFFSAIGKFVKKSVDWVVNTWNNSTVGQVVNKAVSFTWNLVTDPIKTITSVSESITSKVITNLQKSPGSRGVKKKPNYKVPDKVVEIISPKVAAQKNADFIMAGNSKRGIGDQRAELRGYLTTAGYSEEEIKAKELELIKKYCDRFGLDFASVSDAIAKGKSIVEKNRINSAINTLMPKLQNELMRNSIEKLSMHEFDEYKKKLIDDYCKEHNFNLDERIALDRELEKVKNRIEYKEIDTATWFTGVAIVATAIGLGAFAYLAGAFALGALKLGSLSVAAANGIANLSVGASLFSWVAIQVKKISGMPLSGIDEALEVINVITMMGAKLISALVQIAGGYIKGTGNNDSNQGYVTGEDWNNYFKEKYGASNVQWKPNSFQDIIDNPQRLWGCTPSEIESILGDGWQFKTYGSNGQGWEFHSPQGRVFYHAGGGIHGGSYYGFGTGPTGVVKLVDGEYIYFPDEKSTIIPRD